MKYILYFTLRAAKAALIRSRRMRGLPAANDATSRTTLTKQLHSCLIDKYRLGIGHYGASVADATPGFALQPPAATRKEHRACCCRQYVSKYFVI